MRHISRPDSAPDGRAHPRTRRNFLVETHVIRRAKTWIVLLLALFVLPEISNVEAQWVMAARAAKNRIQQTTRKSGNAGYDVAIVFLGASSGSAKDNYVRLLLYVDKVDFEDCHYKPSLSLPRSLKVHTVW